MTEPTTTEINEAINHFQYAEATEGYRPLRKQYALAIRALEEMKEKHAPAKIKIAGPKEVWISRDGGKGWDRCNDAEFVSEVTSAVLWPKSETKQPRSPRDVTVGEMLDLYESFGWTGAQNTMRHHAQEIISKEENPPIPKHWTSIGA